jgi:hypothetical protein
MGYVFQDREKEVEAGGAQNFDVRGDRKREGNVEGVVMDGRKR